MAHIGRDVSDSLGEVEDMPMDSEVGQNKDKDSVDALSGGFQSGDGRQTMSSEYEHRYRMNYPNRGLAVIINNRDFNPRTHMNKRTGTDVDAAYLNQRFTAMGFRVQQFVNQTASQMLSIMSEAGKYDHSNNDCFVCMILSHGDEGIVYGTDATIKVDTLIEPVKGDNCKSLLGKPKLFFIQACRGNQLDHGADVADSDADETDALPRGRRIPFEADILLAFSTVPGYYSWRNSTKGSWFVQALNKVLERHGSEMEIMCLLTRVNHMVAFEFESNASQEYMNQKKQIPCIQSMLTKALFFTPKTK